MSTNQTRWTLAALASSLLLASLDTSIANTALPTIAHAFHASFHGVQWVVLAYLLAITTLIVSAGRLGDLMGRRRLLLLGIGGFTLSSAACGVASTLAALIAARAIQGLAAAVMIALSIAFVSDAVPKEKTGSAMGLLGTTSAIGTALGPSVGGMLIAAFHWRAIFFVNIPIGCLAIFLAWRFLPADAQRPSRERARLDLPGTALLALTLGAYALAMTRGPLALLFVAAAGVVTFVLVEMRVASPLVSLALFRRRTLSEGFAMSIFVTTVVMATLVVGPFYLSDSLGLSAARAGLVLSCGPLVAALTGIPAGRIVDRLGTQRTTVAGLLAMLLGSSMLAMLRPAFGVAGYIAPIAILTAGYALFQAANNTAVMTDAGAEQRGVVSGLLNLSRNLGLITGTSMMGALFAFGGMSLTFAVAAALMLAALLVAAARFIRLPAIRASSTHPAARPHRAAASLPSSRTP